MQPKEDNPPSFSFPKKERICSDLDIETLIAKKQSCFCYPFKCFYDFSPVSESRNYHRFAVSVSKKRFKHAVDRNLLKRRTREAYRLNKSILDAITSQSGRCVSVFFVFVGREMPDYDSLNDKIIMILNRLVVINSQFEK
ncbi:MAG: ribonuclease P protein component [Bacteroidales bacterium]|nr:ribonuclease P protein component [Bacteroidales bacterium]